MYLFIEIEQWNGALFKVILVFVSLLIMESSNLLKSAKLPQQEALTEFRGQVNAYIRVVLVTHYAFRKLCWK